MKIGVGIPAYRNADNLRRCLCSIAAISPGLMSYLVIVDDSGDGSVAAQLASEYSQVKWIVHEQNLGFGVSANECVNQCPADVVILLNDDVELCTDPVPHLYTIFQNDSLFAATFQSVLKDGRFREGAKRLVWPMGFPRILHNPADQFLPVNGCVPSAYAVGGHAAFHKQRFTEFGGFDPLYAPFYWEDVDLGERARRTGWHIFYLPECQVVHDGASAIRSKHDAEYLREITLRNRLLFAWKYARGLQRLLLSLSLAYHFLFSIFYPHCAFRATYRAARLRYRQFLRSP